MWIIIIFLIIFLIFYLLSKLSDFLDKSNAKTVENIKKLTTKHSRRVYVKLKKR